MTDVLNIRDLTLSFRGYSGVTEVLHGISLDIRAGERVALVGESGSGKSVTARLVLGQLQEQRATRVTGDLVFEGQDLNRLSRRQWHGLRGTKMSMIFQDPTSSLNPVFTIGNQFTEVLRRRTPRISKDAAFERAEELLNSVSIHDPARVLKAYPFQLSGGMNQRVTIAMALANRPSLLIADEPGTALDVTVQAQTLHLMHDLVERTGTAVLFISHNLGVVREFADRVYVIYRGRIVEQGATRAVFDTPGHPYTRALMAAVPRITGGGIPEISDMDDAFLEPSVTHAEGAA
ncbi:MAG: ABC transporter ATP-binding protein [Maritimibacter sp.]|nr:ABC transporter ATP-binding protein [Maritimibacter sp.]